jgi:hypothetical protein
VARDLCYKSSGRRREHGMTNPAIADTANEDTTVRKIADEAFAAFNSGHHVLPFSTRYPAFSLNDAYRAAALARSLRRWRLKRPAQSRQACPRHSIRPPRSQGVHGFEVFTHPERIT